MRRPNGYGTITKLSGNRRKPWAVKVTDKNINVPNGKKQVRKYLGYYATRKEAEARLVEYNYGLINLDKLGITLKELKELWQVHHYQVIGESSIDGYEAAFKLWEPLHDMTFESLRHYHLQSVLNEIDLSYSSKSKMRALMGMLYKYALINDVVIKDYSQGLVIGNKEKSTKHKPFTQEEIKRLFKAQSIPYVDVILIQIHTGMRSNELFAGLEIHDGYLIGGSKTAAGRNRVIPLHKNIEAMVVERFDKYGKLTEEKLTSGMYRYRFKKVMEELDMDHLPHDCRHTFATEMNKTKANQLAVKRIIGHAGSGVTENTYTHKDIEDLKEAMGYFPDLSPLL
ncbi:MAG: tyrosine-type recombinase/integrase [Tissierellia bacterium]|nr:tyrosine-type recombinase/integrase [Tissierellia bacterium]